ncbi:TetR/AcrR family transcriptional regulator [Anseongella ginsenosidimutans]|uniref:TetR/AcrR family transcriptional regulator n=1 Tax=Anseongella ginsenosidimutans TaxID=496056 RepID=UPI0021CE78C0|nr:TetR/AcrR family transcriptional regulator [Anseongella ginsenosidimutans]
MAAEELFCRYGIKSITMDDIAGHLGISKKTIYQFYKDKKELVHLLMQKMVSDQQEEISQHEAGAKNAIEEIFAVIVCLQRLMQTINPVIFYDLQKYHPESWKLYQDFRDNFLTRRIKTNLERGISEGLYRKDLDLDIVAIMRINDLDTVFSTQVYSPARFDMGKVLSELTNHYLYGVVSLKGYKLINEYKNVYEED